MFEPMHTRWDGNYLKKKQTVETNVCHSTLVAAVVELRSCPNLYARCKILFTNVSFHCSDGTFSCSVAESSNSWICYLFCREISLALTLKTKFVTPLTRWKSFCRYEADRKASNLRPEGIQSDWRMCSLRTGERHDFHSSSPVTTLSTHFGLLRVAPPGGEREGPERGPCYVNIFKVG